MSTYVTIKTATCIGCVTIPILFSACTSSRVVSKRVYDNFDKSPGYFEEKAKEAGMEAERIKTELLARKTFTAKDTGQPPSTDINRYELAKVLDRNRDDLQAVDALDLERLEAANETELANLSAGRQLKSAKDTGDDVYAKALSFSVQPLVAVRSHLESTAIAAFGVNWRVLPEGKDPLAVQLVLGGALNPSSSGSDVGAAIGLGLSHPVSKNGAISLGYIVWRQADTTLGGCYIGISLGDFGKSSTP
jgi:hypothetical protein